jgi:CysZ protein
MKSFFEDCWRGFAAYGRSLILLIKHSLWVYFFIPALLSLGIAFGGAYFLEDLRTAPTLGVLPAENFEYELLFTGIKALFVFVALKMNKYLVLILLSPVLARLSAQTERILTNKRYPFHFGKYINDILRGIQIAVRNMFIQMFILAIWLFFTLLFPVLQPASVWVMFGIGFYFYGFYFMDYVSERVGFSMNESIVFIRKHAGLAFITGGIFSCIFLIPYAGGVIAPVLATIAATVAVHKIIDKKPPETK